ncbi:MAG TPA: polysaccharide biosynthesis tyrosine autokinase [Opitutaceae bacterium]|nr:polysaccharide biosynthesis tyrosine autokinase [Opitutaceae bacterium]
MADANIKPPTSPSKPLHGKDDDVVERRTLRDYYIILRERFWPALGAALLIVLPLGYYQAHQPKIFMARATMEFEKPERVITSEGVVDPSVKSDIDLNTYLEDLNSGRLRTKVVESLTPDEVKILQRPSLKNLAPGDAPPPASSLLGSLGVSSVRNSFLISITVTHEDPEAAALIANHYIDQFMRYLMENVGGRNEAAVEYLTTRSEELRKESEIDDQKLEAYMKEHKLVSFDSSVNIITDRLKSLNTALEASHQERLSLDTLNNQVQAYQKAGRDLLEISYIANHGTVPEIRARLDDLKRTQAALSQRYLERHPKMIDVVNAINVAQDQLNQAITLAIEELQTSLAKAHTTESTLQDDYANQEQEQLRLRDLSVDYRILENQASVAKSNYIQILDRLNQATNYKNLENIPVHPLDRATPPGAPFTPNLSHILRTCGGLGVLIFVGTAIGLSFLDDRIKSAWDVESFIGVNLLGIIPDLDNLKDEEKHSLVLGGANTTGTESFLSVYSSVKIHSKLDFPKSILITSTIPGEGKTLVSCNLASAFARHGKRTLLIDCDLRRPMLHRHFKQENKSGLIPWFENGASLDDDLANNPHLGIIQVAEDFYLLCSGGRSKSPTEILENPAFGQLIDRLKKHFELVIVDSPPLGAVTDSLLIAEHTDEIIYVCRFNRTNRKHIKLYIRSLHNSKNEILGIVLNGLSPRRIEYYSNYRYYRSYKKYYGTQT